MNRSESQCLSILEIQGSAALTPYELYRAHVLLANNGLYRNEEAQLNPKQQELLRVRRLINDSRTSEAREALINLELSTPLLMGDRSFLLAAIAHRSGDPVAARTYYTEAAAFFAQGEDEYRKIRSLINARISERDEKSYAAGSLFALQQEAKRRGFHELAGIVEKARAGQLLSQGQFAEAAVEAENAANSLSLDGCPEDLAVARLLASIARLLLGDLGAAKSHFDQVHLKGGKLSVYQEAFHSILAGKVPSIPKGHPMEGTPWPKLAIKRESVLGKILQRLQEGPTTPDQLIEWVWGKNAIHPSYKARLFTAINKLKKVSGQPVVFDGSTYRLK